MNFRPTDRLTSFLMPPSVDEWLPQRHLARFVVDVVDGLDLSAMSKSYRGSGSASYHPAVLLSLLVYGCATGDIPAANWNEPPTIPSPSASLPRKRPIPTTTPSPHSGDGFSRRSRRCCAQGAVAGARDGSAQDGHGGAGWDQDPRQCQPPQHGIVLSRQHAGKIEAQLKAEVADLLAKAEAADEADVPDGMSIQRNWSGAKCGWINLQRPTQR